MTTHKSTLIKSATKVAAKPTSLHRLSQNVKLQRLSKAVLVPTPNLNEYTSDFPHSSRARSIAKRIALSKRNALHKAKAFKTCAPIFKCPFTLESLEVFPKSKEYLKHLQKICDDDLGPGRPAQVFSGQWYDSNNKPILFYLGQRWCSAPPASGLPLPLSEQYHGRIQADLDAGLHEGRSVVHDGFPPDRIKRLAEATQFMASSLPPVCPTGGKLRDLKAKPNEDPRIMKYIIDHGGDVHEIKEERTGVYHFVNGWVQQGQPEKGQFLSSDYTRTGVGRMAVDSYYQVTELTAEVLKTLFQQLLPECYLEYQLAFDAGVWIQNDPGPWLGRAIVYKLQVGLHNGNQNTGPTVSFPLGNFTGGEMLIPQLGTKLAFRPGDICLFCSTAIYHAIAEWVPGTMKPGDILTPGRIGHVFFSPDESLHQLRGRKPGWARKTGFGKNPDISYK